MKLDSKHTLLLVIDMQKDFYAIDGNAAARGKQVRVMQALPAAITSFAARFRQAGGSVVFTQFIFDPLTSPSNFIDLVDNAKSGNFMCRRNTPGAMLEGVTPAPEDQIIQKSTFDCFAGTNLLPLCHERQIDTIIVSGVLTNVCVMHTAFRAFAEGFRTIVASDLVGTYDNKQAMAAMVLDNLKYACYVLPSHEITASFATMKP